jgi:hypothetical protein
VCASVQEASMSSAVERPLPAQRRRNRPRVPVAARGLFLEALAAGWSVTHAAGRAGVLRQRLYETRELDEAFSAEWDQALAAGTDVLEDEAKRRAAEGWDEPVFQRGELVGTVRKYSDNLLMFLLRARDPGRFRESVQVNAGGQVTLVLDSVLARARQVEAIEDAVVVEDEPAALEAGDDS